MGPELYGVKWRHFQLALTVQKYLTDPVGKPPFPHLVNLIADAQASVKRETPIPAGAPLDFVPAQPPD